MFLLPLSTLPKIPKINKKAANGRLKFLKEENKVKRVLIDKEAKFYKANLHTHSTFSDGKLTPEELKAEYKKRGYSILAISDHEHLIDFSYLDDEDFLTITSCELAIKEFPEQSTLKNYNMRVTHLNVYAKDQHNTVTPCYSSVADHFWKEDFKHLIKHNGEYTRVYSPDGVNDIIAKCNDQGFLVAYNHPTWSLETAEDYIHYSGLFAGEIYNHGCAIQSGINDEGALDNFWRAGKPLLCLCGDDAHEVLPADENSDAFGGFIMLSANSLCYKDVMHALEGGDFYASSGPKIYSLIVENDVAKIEFSPSASAHLITSGRRTDRKTAKQNETISYAEFPLMESDGYFRITVVDKSGKKAYTQFYEI